MSTLWCAACQAEQPYDGQWRSLYIDGERNCIVSRPWRSILRPPDARFHVECEVYVCGQGAAMVLLERFLERGTFEPAEVAQLEEQLQRTLPLNP